MPSVNDLTNARLVQRFFMENSFSITGGLNLQTLQAIGPFAKSRLVLCCLSKPGVTSTYAAYVDGNELAATTIARANEREDSPTIVSGEHHDV
ncbi:MAG: hypothetical protein KF752_02210 [Pirellulaceae bacterium]|nr:hypothetical protein [Pirellulaceae bacterium]